MNEKLCKEVMDIEKEQLQKKNNNNRKKIK